MCTAAHWCVTDYSSCQLKAVVCGKGNVLFGGVLKGKILEQNNSSYVFAHYQPVIEIIETVQ